MRTETQEQEATRILAIEEPEEQSLERLEQIATTLSHALDCPSRHHGECLCIRNEILTKLDEYGRGI